jgi:hypothetical protein
VIRSRPSRIASAALLGLLPLLGQNACRPKTIAEAEAQGDVRWLDEHGTPDAIAAIGRIADTQPAAIAALDARSSFDVQSFVVAWEAVGRGARWGSTLIRSGLADPKRADVAASALPRRDARVLPFLGDLEAALVRLAATNQNLNVAGTLASVGPTAHDAIARRMADASTRGAMCRGIGSAQADPDARAVLMTAPQAARDSPSCVDAVVRVASGDDRALSWLAEQGEPGLLGAAGKSDALSCARLHVAWTRATASRSAEDHQALVVPLSYAIKRCPGEMDGVLADALAHHPVARATVVLAIDPFGSYGDALPATCAALAAVASGVRDGPVVRERASDTLSHACKPPGR